MSGTTKYPAVEVYPHAEQFGAGIADLCARVEIAGSLRRGKPMVGDIEVVAQPHDAPTLLARLDTWVATGRAFKAVYRDGAHRWGAKYRGVKLPGCPAKIELWLADALNFGWILALRTGSADANEFMMRQMNFRGAPFRAREGYWWAQDRRIAVPDEAEVFRLWGLSEPVPPPQRELSVYQRLFARPAWGQHWTYADAEVSAEPMQREMF